MPLFSSNKPIREIINYLGKISEADSEQKIGIYSDNEIAKLAEAITGTVNRLKEKINEQKKENSQTQAILNSMVEGVIAIDKNKKIISINPAITKIFDVAKENAEGKPILEVIRNDDIFEVITSVLTKGEFITKELNLFWPIHKIFKISASPIFENNDINGCVILIYDVTEVRKLESMRSQFVANVSHELKTPLTSIKGFAETLLEGALDDKENSRHFIKIIHEHAERLNNLINELLDLSQIESGKTNLEIKNLPVKSLVDNIRIGFETQLKKKNINFTNVLPDNLFIAADENKIKLVLNNLIDNAIKFNKDNGFIKISAQVQADGIRIIIEDSGIGIPQEDIDRIFERFYRVDKGRSRDLGGTGLGLSIAKHIIELHSGTIGAESTEGAGSKFWFNLPI
jgi:two-component system phosphate regulon sensor histidine kinase PhoR